MKLILVGLTLICSILWYPGYTQPSSHHDTVYCLSIEKARLLVEDALRLRTADSLNNLLSDRVVLLEDEKRSSYQSFTNLLKIEQEKTQYHKEISKHMESLASSFRTERDYYQKRERNQRRKKNVLTYLEVGLVILIVVK